MVNMHHIVARLKLFDFLECESHLTSTGFGSAQLVFMIAVEDLVVAEET